MQQTLPRSGLLRGCSFFSASLMAHVVVGAAIALAMMRVEPTVIEEPQEYLDLGYEQFEEPPEPAAEAKPVQRDVAAEPVPQEVDTKVDTAPRELQDESSTIAGTQEAAKTAPVAAAPSGTQAAPSVPYYKIKPKYPREALIAGVEGYVELKIDVKEDGSVENIRSLGGAQADMFESEARRAVSKWKYKPFTDASGQVIRKADHQVRVEFTLKDTENM